MANTSRGDAALIAELNDLIQLDHDAVDGYTIAIDRVKDPARRQSLVDFRADHKRHIEELVALVRQRGGLPTELPHPTGAIKLAVQALGAIGNDVSLLLAFKAVEGQVRDKYRRASQRALPTDVSAVVARAAADEERHYQWVERTLAELGAGSGTISHGVASAVERVHKLLADPLERVEREVMRGVGAAVGTTRTRGGAEAPLPTDAPPAAQSAAPGTARPTSDGVDREIANASSFAASAAATAAAADAARGAASASGVPVSANVGARQFIDALKALEEGRDVERIIALFDEQSEISNPHDERPHQGREGARHFWHAYRESFEEIHSHFSRVVEEDGTAMLEWRSHGRTRTGHAVDYSGVSVLDLRDGKVRRFRAYFDPSALEG
ncbi:MAG TPA: nuclear transport factor 2 family protein [Gemmatimonadaceae bacterium]|nr:nuclear transport factor 2 family protein [Gemmatimonadaceae bacterium]